MTIRFTEGEEAPEDVLGFTDYLYRLAMRDVRKQLETYQAEVPEDVKSVKTTVQTLRDLGKMLVQERAHVETLRKQSAGAAGAGNGLDLDAARDEIGRRLACLRAARGD